MEFIITIIVLIGIIIVTILLFGAIAFISDKLKRKNDKETFNHLLSKMSEAQRRYLIIDNEDRMSIAFYTRNGYRKVGIKGLEYRNLNIQNVGKFDGYAKIEPDNPKDPLAIAVYREDGKLFGYVPCKQNISLHSYIASKGGYVHAYGYIKCYCYTNSGYIGWYGEVCVRVNDNNDESNAFSNNEDKFYCTDGCLQDFLETKQKDYIPFKGQLLFDVQNKSWFVRRIEGNTIFCEHLEFGGCNKGEITLVESKTFHKSELHLR